MLGHYSAAEFIGFFLLIAFFLWVDLRAHSLDEAPTMRSSLLWSILWISLALVFGVYIGFTHTVEDASLYFAGYFLEKSLSVDNLFVIMAIFKAFGIMGKYQHRVLFYGILGAQVFRMLFIAAGSTLVGLFGAYALCVLGLFVLWSAWKMWQQMNTPEREIEDYSNHWSVRFTQRFVPVTNTLHGHDFFVKAPSDSGSLVWKATPLFLCLVVVELCDVMFAFDSIPAILAITQEPFLVYTSNIFAILGMRSMFFLLAAAAKRLVHLEKAVIAILAYIGIKMMLGVSGILHVHALVSLAVVLAMLAFGIIASFVWPGKEEEASVVSEEAAAQLDKEEAGEEQK